MTLEERQIRSVFFQAGRINIYENAPTLVVSLANAFRAAVKEALDRQRKELHEFYLVSNILGIQDFRPGLPGAKRGK